MFQRSLKSVPLTTTLAWRFLRDRHQDRFFSWISTLSVLGIAISVAALIATLSVINGFETQLRERFLAANAHILFYRYPSGLQDWPTWQRNLENKFGPEATGVAPFIHFDTMARFGNQLRAVTVRGIVPRLRESVQPLRRIIEPVSALDLLDQDQEASVRPELPPVILGSGFARQLGIGLGDTLDLVWASDGDGQTLATRFKVFRVVGIYDSGLGHYDNKLALMSLASAQDVVDLGQRVTGMEIGLVDPGRSSYWTKVLEAGYSVPLTIKDWTTFNEALFRTIETERALIALIVALVAFVANFNILTTLFVSVTQRESDIGLLRALGAQQTTVRGIFVQQSALMGALGSGLGCGLAALIGMMIEHTELGRLPDIYLLQHLPVEYRLGVYLGVSGMAVGVAVLAGLYPAIVASRTVPLHGLLSRRDPG